MTRISSCRVCNSDGLVDFFDLGVQPPANSLLDSPEVTERCYPLELSYCNHCGLAQLNYTADPKELFSRYVWLSGTSKTAREHANRFCKEVLLRVQDLENSYALEIGSNDGTFLLPFLRGKYEVLGIDSAENVVDAAAKAGVPTRCGFFDVNMAERILKEKGPSKTVFARNVVPHVANLHEFVEGMKICLAQDGIIVIEFHYGKVIQDELHYDSIYHEHLCYFTLKTLEHLLAMHGLFVFDVIRSPISGGSLVTFIRKGRTNERITVEEVRAEESATHSNELQNWKRFAARSEEHRRRLLTIVEDIKARGSRIAGWGASARSSTLLNYSGIDSRHIDSIADQNELKQGKYTAGTHILIDSPEKVMQAGPEYVLLLAWNFKWEILESLHGRWAFKGRCIIPLPSDPLVLDVSEN